MRGRFFDVPHAKHKLINESEFMQLLTKHKLIKESEFMELLTNNIKCNDCIKQHYSIYPLLKIFLEKMLVDQQY